MITLFTAGPGFGLPEISPYVTKTEVQLQMAGLAYRKQNSRPIESPKGQLPFIDDDGVLVADSTFIRAHIERKYGFDFDAGLTPLQRAHAWAFERMIENQLCWAMSYGRWIIPENFKKGPARWLDHEPEVVRSKLQAELQGRVADTLRAVGVGRHTPDEITQLGVRSLAALSVQMGEQSYLMGEEHTGVDAIAFGVLAGLMTPFFDSPLRREAEAFANLTAYVDRMMARCFPDHPWEPVSAPHMRVLEPA